MFRAKEDVRGGMDRKSAVISLQSTSKQVRSHQKAKASVPRGQDWDHEQTPPVVHVPQSTERRRSKIDMERYPLLGAPLLPSLQMDLPDYDFGEMVLEEMSEIGSWQALDNGKVGHLARSAGWTCTSVSRKDSGDRGQTHARTSSEILPQSPSSLDDAIKSFSDTFSNASTSATTLEANRQSPTTPSFPPTVRTLLRTSWSGTKYDVPPKFQGPRPSLQHAPPSQGSNLRDAAANEAMSSEISLSTNASSLPISQVSLPTRMSAMKPSADLDRAAPFPLHEKQLDRSETTTALSARDATSITTTTSSGARKSFVNRLKRNVKSALTAKAYDDEAFMEDVHYDSIRAVRSGPHPDPYNTPQTLADDSQVHQPSLHVLTEHNRRRHISQSDASLRKAWPLSPLQQGFQPPSPSRGEGYEPLVSRPTLKSYGTIGSLHEMMEQQAARFTLAAGPQGSVPWQGGGRQPSARRPRTMLGAPDPSHSVLAPPIVRYSSAQQVRDEVEGERLQLAQLRRKHDEDKTRRKVQEWLTTPYPSTITEEGHPPGDEEELHLIFTGQSASSRSSMKRGKKNKNKSLKELVWD